MTRSTHKCPVGASFLGFLAALWLAGGCAPADFDRAIAYYADKAAVTDAAARHTTASPYYRFNTALISDLDDALGDSSPAMSRKQAVTILRASNALSQASTANEIERMPAKPREALAALVGVESGATALRQHFVELADAGLQRDLQDMDSASGAQWQKRIKSLRRGIEPLADDKGRLQRRMLLLWAAIPTAMGIAREEAKLPQKIAAKASKAFDRIAIWQPAIDDANALIDRYAPIIAMAWPDARPYDVAFDSIGAVTLSRLQAAIEVTIDPEDPTVYAYTTRAKINGCKYAQLNYVWWFPERPEMAKGDPVAGHIDGAMIRITLNANGQPIFIESTLNCGCAHEVFVSQDLESAARQAFGPPLPGKRFAIERRLPGRHDVIAINTFDPGANPSRPIVFAAAGYHEVCRIEFDAPESIAGARFTFGGLGGVPSGSLKGCATVAVGPPQADPRSRHSPFHSTLQGSSKHYVAYTSQKRRPLQGRAVAWRRDPGAALRLPPATLGQAFSLQSQPPMPVLSRTAIAGRQVVGRASYRLVSYDVLDRLPLDGGIASMFGPDGLVHHAGRPEGFLLAASGILSAGQPRKRGTQRIRWDDFLHDDPHLLEKTLRMPPLD